MEKDLDYWKEFYRNNTLSPIEETELIMSGNKIQLRAYIETTRLNYMNISWFYAYASEELIAIYEARK